ncbi:ABC transporter permease [Amycolatopsis alkalitolerans]|uniref:ABC transporter permease subunit n=1 Tax=Amycolatopsis alkalitolerans TaxID=2547244 RepID=A0A5C4M4S9_9PSEU|nr:ABC transporter permease subunit [Amycolatopsis alkalitolerans]TNC28159.1 ABC transporter permease subunit [Amycolatopsis alkalitolerans]
MRSKPLLLASPPILVIAAFIGFPVVAAVLYTFGFGGGPNSVIAAIAQNQHLASSGTFAAYAEVLGDPQVLRDLVVTLAVTVLTVVVVLLLAGAIALHVRLTGSRTAKLLAALSVVPLFIPVVIGAYAIRGFYASDGFFRTFAEHLGWNAPTLSYTMGAITIGEIWTSVPFGVLLLTSGFAAVPDAQIEAARDAGASVARTVRAVILPMSSTSVVIVTTFTAINVMGSFTVPYMTGPASPNMLGVTMTNYFISFNQPQQSEVMAMVVFVAAALIGVWYVRANVRSAR